MTSSEEGVISQGVTLSVELGATIPIPDSFGNIKPSVRISGIRLDGDVEAQVTAAVNELPYIFRILGDQLEIAAMDVTAPIMGDETMAQRLRSLEGDRSVYNKNFEQIKQAIEGIRGLVTSGKSKAKAKSKSKVEKQEKT